jgi:subtilisin family serine protease
MTSKSRFILTVVLLLAVVPAFGQSTETIWGHQAAARRVLVHIPNPNPGVLQALQQVGDASALRTLSAKLNLYVLDSKSKNVPWLVNALSQNASVAYVEPDFIVKTSNTPNDPYFNQQWSLLNTAFPGADIGATAAWNVTTGSTANVIGVVDTGLDYTHPDLAANAWTAPAQFTVTLSWGTLTCPAGSHGYNGVTRTCDPMDDHGHGTHVSGTIGAVGKNGVGVTGVNWTTRIMGLKFLDSNGTGTTSDAIDAMEFGLQAQAAFGSSANLRVFSASWGGDGYDQALLDEINKAGSANVLFVTAAGNSGASDDTLPSYPAAFNAPTQITVAATTMNDTMAGFSSFGKGTVHLGAPGVNIISTLPGANYGFLSGTSMATPHVSGAAMLVLSKCNLNVTALKSAILSSVDVLSSLAGLTVTGGRLNVNKAVLSCAAPTPTPAPTGTASFVKTDTTTQGTWRGAYGADGYNVFGSAGSSPSYVTVTPTGNNSYTWASTTTDPRALQKSSSSIDRIAASWFTSGTMSIDLNFTGTTAHQVAIYLLDWDGFLSGRSERVDVVDANGVVLDSHAVSSFAAGQYLVWNLTGHVRIQISNTNLGSNAVVSGLFFGLGGTAAPPAQSTAVASFVQADTATAGTWKGVYGADGYYVIGDSSSNPNYVTVGPAGYSTYTWTSSTTDARALQKGVSTTDRMAATWFTDGTMTIDLNFTDGASHQTAIYLLDWDTYFGGRLERVDVLDGNGKVLDTRSVSGFRTGEYLVWNFTGHVIIRIANMNPLSNAVISGLFFGLGGLPAPAPQTNGAASFLKSDTATGGAWNGIYGADGYGVVGDQNSYPSYVAVTPIGASSYTWASSTSDARAPRKAPPSVDRIAACWYDQSTFAIDLDFKDNSTHQVALYLLDWDNYFGRAEKIEILDPNSNVLDTRTVSAFFGGQYLVWNMSGHVSIRITNTNPLSNAVVSGVFFR